MTVQELLAELKELLDQGHVTPDSPVLLSVGVLKGVARKKVADADCPTLGGPVVNFGGDAVNLDVDDSDDVYDDDEVIPPAKLWISGGTQMEIPPIL